MLETLMKKLIQAFTDIFYTDLPIQSAILLTQETSRYRLNGRFRYNDVRRGGNFDSTRYGDWEYNGRCTDF